MAERRRESLVGHRFGQYELQRRLGRGGMGEVYLARDCALERPVAVKVLLSGFIDDPDAVNRFRREAQAVARLSHPNIVQIHTVDVDTDPPYMAMEYVDGASLDVLLRRDGAMSWQQAFTICGQVASALACAHDQGIVHRDVKPGNILIDQTRRARVTDFGVAKVFDASTQLTSTGALMGSPFYMSPEQWGDGELGPDSDLYSLGVTMFELISGELPFRADTTAALVKKVTLDEPPRLADCTPHVPRIPRDIVATLMARERDKRYASAAHVLEDLRCLQTNTPLKHLPSLKSAGAQTTTPSLVAATVGAETPLDISGETTVSPVDALLEGTEMKVRPLPPASASRFPWGLAVIVAASVVAVASLVALLTVWQRGSEQPEPPSGVEASAPDALDEPARPFPQRDHGLDGGERPELQGVRPLENREGSRPPGMRPRNDQRQMPGASDLPPGGRRPRLGPDGQAKPRMRQLPDGSTQPRESLPEIRRDRRLPREEKAQ